MFTYETPEMYNVQLHKQCLPALRHHCTSVFDHSDLSTSPCDSCPYNGQECDVTFFSLLPDILRAYSPAAADAFDASADALADDDPADPVLKDAYAFLCSAGAYKEE